MATPSPSSAHPPVQTGIRRSFTAPPRSLSYHEKAGLDPSDSAAEILYSHPLARIVKFTPSTSTIQTVSSPKSQDFDYPVDTIETLPWRASTELPMASAPMIIEKVKGSTNFLKCGAVMHAIMRNSQCWCVDGESKFVLRIQKFQYYRIELPSQTQEERDRIRALKECLPKILRFEKTPCPFKRAFHVELPEEAITPRRKGPWKRRQSSVTSTPTSSIPSPLGSGRCWKRPVPQTADQSPRAGEEEYEDDSNETDSDVESPAEDLHDIAQKEDAVATMEETASKVDDQVQTDENSGELPTDASVADNGLSLSNGDNEEPEGEFAKSNTDDLLNPGPALYPADFEQKADHNIEEEQEHQGEAPTSPRVVEGSASNLNDIRSEKDEEEESGEESLSSSHTHEQRDSASEDEHVESNDQPTEDEQAIDRVLTGDTDTASIASSMKSFYSVDQPEDSTSHSSIFQSTSEFDNNPPSPTSVAEPQDSPRSAGRPSHRRVTSEITLRASSPASFRPSTSASDRPSTPLLVRSSASDTSWPDVETPSSLPMQGQLRNRLKERRSLSPLPSASVGLQTSSPRSYDNYMTSELLRKTLQLALSKPIEVVVMVFHILARIVGGATVNDLMNGNLFKKPETRHGHRRNFSLPDQKDGRREDDWDEDDFGISLRSRSKGPEIINTEPDEDSLHDLD